MIGFSIGTSDDELDESALLDQLANEAVIDVLARTRINVRTADVLIEPVGATEFDIDPSIMRILSIDRPAGTPLEEQNHSALDSFGYAFLGFSRIRLGLAAGDNEMLTIEYVPAPTPMTLDSHDPSDAAYGRIPAQFHRALVDYMCWHGSDKMGDQGSARGEKYRAIYEGQNGLAGPGSDLGRIKQETNRRGSNMVIKRHRELLTSDRDPSFWMG